MEKAYLGAYSRGSRKSIDLILFTLGALFFSSCTSLSLINSIPEVESPTMQGNNNRIGFELSGIGGKELIVVDDPSKRPLSVNNNALKTSAAFFTRTGISWYPSNFLSFTGGLQNSSALYLKSKAVLLGSYREDSEPGRFYLSLNFETTYEQAKKSGDQNGIGGPTGFPWEGTSQNVSGTAGISFGYQMFKRAVPFVGYNYQQFQTTGHVKQTAAGASAGGEYDLGVVTGVTNILGFGIEFRPRNRLYITPLVQLYNFTWGGNKTQDVTGSIRITYVPL